MRITFVQHLKKPVEEKQKMMQGEETLATCKK